MWVVHLPKWKWRKNIKPCFWGGKKKASKEHKPHTKTNQQVIDFWKFPTALWQDPLCYCSLGTILVTVLVPRCFASSCLDRARPLLLHICVLRRPFRPWSSVLLQLCLCVVIALGSSFNHLQLPSFIRWRLCGSEQRGLAWAKSLIAFRSAPPGNSQHCHPARPRPGHSLPAHSLPTGMPKEKNKINLIDFLFATLLLYVSQRSVQSWKSHLLAASCLTSWKSWGQSHWKRRDNLVFRKSWCESWFHHISINLLFKCTENSFVHWQKQSNYCSPQLKGRSGNGCWLFLFRSFAFVNDCWEQLD